MYRKILFLILVVGLVSPAGADYVIVDVPNYSFELPADGKHNAWDIESNAKGDFTTDVPNWFSDYTAADSGVEGPDAWPGTTEGHWAGFMMNAPDPSVWQILGYKVKDGDQFCLAVDAQDNWTDNASLPTTLQMTLFYIEDGGPRVPIKSEPAILVGMGADTWATYLLNVPDASAAVGRLLGIELQNVSTGESSSWMGIDNVRFIPEPATVALLSLGVLSLLRRRRT